MTALSCVIFHRFYFSWVICLVVSETSQKIFNYTENLTLEKFFPGKFACIYTVITTPQQSHNMMEHCTCIYSGFFFTWPNFCALAENPASSVWFSFLRLRLEPRLLQYSDFVRLIFVLKFGGRRNDRLAWRNKPAIRYKKGNDKYIGLQTQTELGWDKDNNAMTTIMLGWAKDNNDTTMFTCTEAISSFSA